MIRLNPLTRKKLQRFRSIKRGWWSFLLLVGAFGMSLVAELWVSKKALIVSYEGNLYFPTYSSFYSGEDFGIGKDSAGASYSHEVNYRDLKKHFQQQGEGNWVLLPLVPWDRIENDFSDGKVAKPLPPNFSKKHYLGTDSTGRDILARLVYGFRVAMVFALGFVVMVYVIGIIIGGAMGYFGGSADLIGQRLVEIWSNIPFLYMVIILVSILPPSVTEETRILLLLLIMVLFSWTTMTYYMRSAVYKEKARDYVAAAQSRANSLHPFAAEYDIDLSHLCPIYHGYCDHLNYGIRFPGIWDPPTCAKPGRVAETRCRSVGSTMDCQFRFWGDGDIPHFGNFHR